jgi:hypothetical protein
MQLRTPPASDRLPGACSALARRLLGATPRACPGARSCYCYPPVPPRQSPIGIVGITPAHAKEPRRCP